MARGRPATPPGTWGEVSAVQQPNGRWQAQLRVRLLDGQTRRIRANGTSKSAAVRAAKEKAAAATGTQDTDTLTTTSPVTALIEQYLDQLDATEGTKNTYRATHRNHIEPGIGQLRLNEATTGRLDVFLRGLTPGTWKSARALLSGAFRMATRYGLVTHNPVRDTTTPPSTRPEARALTVAEIHAVRAMARYYTHAERSGPATRAVAFPWLIDVLIGTGVRISDALRLQWADVNLAADPPTAIVRDVKKGEQPRVIQLPQIAADALRAQQRATRQVFPWVFPTGTGQAVSVSNAERWLRLAKQAWEQRDRDAGAVEPPVGWVTFHTFRKTVATVLSERVSLEAASQQLGHSDTTITEHHYLDRTAIAPPVAEVLDGFLSGQKMAK